MREENIKFGNIAHSFSKIDFKGKYNSHEKWKQIIKENKKV